MMPGIDGFETCRRLKAEATTQNIPVIFMTALAQGEDKVRGFRAGAVDYVTKPLHQEEVLARVSTHLRLRALTRELEEANRHLEQSNRDKDRFFSILAHDLRGPFLPLLGSAELLAKRASTLAPAKVQGMGDSIYTAAKQVLNLLENLLQWGKLQMGQIEFRPRRFNLAALLQRNVTLFDLPISRKQLQVENRLPTPFFVYGDERMIEVVVRNLLSNAIKFTPCGGEVTVTAVSHDDATATITISDTGVGLSPARQEKLFAIGAQSSTPGTADEPGSGLGLILCREMVEKNGGKIWLESEPGRGTAVSFTIPLPPSSQPAAPASS
jgi:signal transduction histidine kinase